MMASFTTTTRILQVFFFLMLIRTIVIYRMATGFYGITVRMCLLVINNYSRTQPQFNFLLPTAARNVVYEAFQGVLATSDIAPKLPKM